MRNCGERVSDDMPFIALLVHSNVLNPSSKRGAKRTLSKAVLISDRFVLSTVSSLYHSESFWSVTAVRLGDYVTWNGLAVRDGSLTREIQVAEIFTHQKKDLALIRLRETATFSDVIRPVCLPSSENEKFEQLKTHLCRRVKKGQQYAADVTLESAVNYLFYFLFFCNIKEKQTRKSFISSR